MLNTIRAKFAAVLLVGLIATVSGLGAGASSPDSVAANPALVASITMLATMLLIERIVINPITRLTQEAVLLANRSASDPTNRLAVKGSDEVATLARTFNDLIAHLGMRQELERRLEHMAHHDALTDLPNRLRLRQAMERELSRVQRGECIAVLCLDLDHFKSVNDTLGHPVGDRLLETVAERLRQSVRETDVVARVGGDEFAIVQVSGDQPRGAIILADRLIAAPSKPLDLDGHQVVVGTSVGIALAPLDGLETDQLIKNADMALYRAKADGRGVFRFFEPEMDARMQSRRTLELDLRRALAEGEFELYYQPLVNVASNAISGFEALLRWNHTTRGLVPPSEFIPVAAEMGLIVPLGETILQQACLEAAGWPDDIKVAVNLSPVQFKSKTLALAVTSALASSGLSPHRLELEITEGVLLQDSEATLATLHQLRALGVRISMDDFGTGYSSLSYLRSFPFDKIKIDQSFVRGMSSGQNDSVAIIRAVTGLGRNLGMATTAEGVETLEQLGHLRQEGCTEVQGYLFSRPLPARDVLHLLETGRREARSAA